MTKIFIDGSEGTTGLLLRDRLKDRPELTLVPIDPEKRKDISARRAAMAEADLVFLCLPDAAAKESAEAANGLSCRILDTSTAHRTLSGWSYGFPELSKDHRKGVEDGARIAVPGCHASGFISLVYPLIAAGLMPKDYPVTCHSVTGYTGGGKKMIADYEGENRDKALDSPRQYGLTQSHKHLKEMQAITGLSFAPQFSPIVADFPRGMVVTVPLFSKLLKGNPTKQQIHELLSAHYEGQAFVRVLSLDGEEEGIGGLFEANAMEGRNSMEILVTGNDERPLLLSRFDNLGKGASGAAMQCMNIMLGVPEDTGLLL